MKHLLYNALIVNEGRKFEGAVEIEDGLIKKIHEGPLPPDLHLDAVDKTDLKGAYLLPGIIDDQVHFREPGLTHKGDIQSESRAAIAGGVTSFMDMPNTKPPTLTQTLLEEKYKRASEVSLANYSFYMGCSEDNLEEVLKTDPKKCCGIKLFLGSSTGNMLVENSDYLNALFQHSPCLIAVHCEEESIIAKNLAEAKEKYSHPPFAVHAWIRSAEACYVSSAKAAERAEKYNTRLHILHLSTAKELELLDTHPVIEERKITGEICVHHLWFTDADYEKMQWRIKWNPAIKTMEDREALRKAVNENKAIVATDHAPHCLEEKQNPYFSCPSGGPMVQHSLPLMLEMCHQGIFTIEKVVEVMAHQVARTFRIKNRGFIREGYAADLTVVEKKDFPIGTAYPSSILYKCGWSPLEGCTLHHQVTQTFVNGNLVYKDGVFMEDSPMGQRLEFNI